MAGVKWITSKKYPGIRWHEGQHGRVFYITYTRDGKKIWEKVGGDWEGYSLETAKDVRATRVKQLRHKEDIPKDRKAIPTFGEIADEFLKWAKANKRSWKDDQTRYDLYLKSRFKSTPADHVRALDLERLKRAMLEGEKAPATIKQVLALFRAIFNKGKVWHPILADLSNPVGSVKLPKLNNQRVRFLSREELDTLFAELQKNAPQAYKLAYAAYHTGARFTEIATVKGRDIDLEGRNITFRDTKNHETGKVPLNDQIYEFLKASMPADPNDYVFQAGKGKRQGEQVKYLSTAFQRSADRLFNQGLTRREEWKKRTKKGAPQKDAPKGPKESSKLTAEQRRGRVVFHTLRHTFASHLIMAGEPLVTVKELLRHKSLAMVERYAHLAPDAKRNAVKALVSGAGEFQGGGSENSELTSA